MDFADGAAGYRMAFSYENPALREGRVEFRLDTLEGTLIGEVPITFTGGKTKYVIGTGAVKKIGGIHDLFIIARGRGGDASGHLFNINWFTFTK
jgi:hypothetical protein